MNQIIAVGKQNFAQVQVQDHEDVPLADGQVRLAIERFAFTANNITYAAFGETMSYWNFYPLDEADMGVIPVWGFARVTESKHEQIAVGARYYGYYPMATSVVLTPSHASERGFVEGAANRQALASVYNYYANTAQDPYYTSTSEALQCLYRPLFITSWLIDDFFADQNFFGADTLILSSASSKTAYGTAFCLKERGVKVIGLSSDANLDFCRSLGVYSQVLSYEQLNEIPADARCAYVDFAGNAALRRQIHERFANLAYSASIGGTHVEQLGGARDLPGPKAQLFFAPAQVKKRMTDWGAGEFHTRVLTSFMGFVHAASQGDESHHWLRVHTHAGTFAALEAYAAVLRGKADPRIGHILNIG
jgi:hypothetical protein